jgi:hypothetical protein
MEFITINIPPVFCREISPLQFDNYIILIMCIILLLFLLGSRRPCPTSVKRDYFTIKFLLLALKRFILLSNGGHIISLLLFVTVCLILAHNAHKRSLISNNRVKYNKMCAHIISQFRFFYYSTIVRY